MSLRACSICAAIEGGASDGSGLIGWIMRSPSDAGAGVENGAVGCGSVSAGAGAGGTDAVGCCPSGLLAGGLNC